MDNAVASMVVWIRQCHVPLTRSLGGELLTGRLTAGGLTGCLLGTSHDDSLGVVDRFVVKFVGSCYSY